MKNKLLVIPENKDAIAAFILEKGSNRAQNNLISVDDIFACVKKLDYYTNHLLKKHLKYLRYFHCLNKPHANAYKYRYGADTMDLEWSNKGWVLTSFERRDFYPNERNRSEIYFALNPTKEEDKVILDEIKEFMMTYFKDIHFNTEEK